MSPVPNINQFRDWLIASDADQIRKSFAANHPHLIAEVLVQLEDKEIWALVRGAATKDAAEVLSHLPAERQARLVSDHNDREVALLLAEMAPDDRVDLLNALPESLNERLLTLLPPEKREETQRLAAYASDTVGAVMSSEFAAVPDSMTAAEALDLVRLEAPDKETIYTIFVIDEQSKLKGLISLKSLIMAKPVDRIADIMQRDVISCFVDDPRTEAAEKVKSFDLLALPVINGGGRLVGVVTVDDVVDVVEEEATIDFHKMAPIGLMKMSLKDAGIGILYRARVPWLLVLVFMNIFSGAGIAYFEETLEAMIALAFFLPLLIDSGGNAGSQSATLMVRALATGDVRLRDWLGLLGKEVSIALALGVSMAIAVSLIAAFRAPEIVAIVGMTMVLTVIFGSLVGMSLPFLLTRLKMDPATASAPLITSIADIGGVLIYFSIATWWLGDMIRAAAEASGNG